jgi:hypothetical protein
LLKKCGTEEVGLLEKAVEVVGAVDGAVSGLFSVIRRGLVARTPSAPSILIVGE